MGAAGATTFDAKVSHSIRDSRQLQASANCKENKKIKAQPQTGVHKCKGKRGSLATVSRLVPAIMMTAVGWLQSIRGASKPQRKTKIKCGMNLQHSASSTVSVVVDAVGVVVIVVCCVALTLISSSPSATRRRYCRHCKRINASSDASLIIISRAKPGTEVEADYKHVRRCADGRHCGWGGGSASVEDAYGEGVRAPLLI